MQITFPIFNINIFINKVAFSIFGIQIYWYAIIIICGFLIGLLICKKNDKRYEIRYKDVLDLAVVLIPISILSARIYYVIFKWEYYSNNIFEIFQIRNGGLAIYGGIIGAVITIYFFAKKRKIKILDVLDYIIPALAIGQSIRKMGKFCKCRGIWI